MGAARQAFPRVGEEPAAGPAKARAPVPAAAIEAYHYFQGQQFFGQVFAHECYYILIRSRFF